MAQIALTGSVGAPGNFPILGSANISFASNAAHTLLASEYSNFFLQVTSGVSLTGQQDLIAPLTEGQAFVIQNKTTGGQAIRAIASSGVGIVIANGSMTLVVCDGTNYVVPGSGSSSLAGDVIGTTVTSLISKLQGYALTLGSLTSAQDGYVMSWNNFGNQIDMAPANAMLVQNIPISPTAPSTTGQVLVFNSTTGIWTPAQLTQDQILPAFAPSMSPLSAGPFELGITLTPSFTSNPAFNASGVTLATHSDNQGHTNVAITSNPYGPPTVTSYALTAPGTVTIFSTFTQNGVGPRNTGSFNATWGGKVWFGVGTAGATGFDGTTGALIGATGTLTGSLSTNGVVAFSVSPASQKVYYACDTAYGTRTFTDASHFTFSMILPPTTVSGVTNGNPGVSRSYYLYESTNILTSVANPVSPA